MRAVTAEEPVQGPQEMHRTGSDDPLLARVRAALEAIGLDPARVTPTARLVEDLDLDSLDWVDLAQRLEDDLAISVLDEPLTSVSTIADVLALLREGLDRDRPEADRLDPGAP